MGELVIGSESNLEGQRQGDCQVPGLGDRVEGWPLLAAGQAWWRFPSILVFWRDLDAQREYERAVPGKAAEAEAPGRDKVTQGEWVMGSCFASRG